MSPDIPWHVTAFHADYQMTDPANTTPEMLLKAARIGQRAGLRYVYAGNLPGSVGTLEDTHCYACSRVLVGRYGYLVKSYDVTSDGRCPDCSTPIPGRWDRAFAPQQTAWPFLPAMRLAR